MENQINIDGQNNQKITESVVSGVLQKLKEPRVIILFFLLVILSLGGIFTGIYYRQKQILTSSPSINNVTANWRTYRSIDDSLMFKYPEDWQAEKEEIFGSSTITRFKYNNTPLFVLNIQGNYNQVTGKPYINLAEFLDQRLNKLEDASYINGQMAQSLIDTLKKSKDIFVDGHAAKKIEDQGNPGHVIPYEEIIVFTPNNEAVVSLNYTSSYYDKPRAFDQILSTFKFLDKNSASSEKIISTEITHDCYIKVVTTNKEVLLSTSWTDTGPSSKCYQFVKNIWSPSGQYAAFEGISGGLDSQIRVFALTQNNNQSHNLEVLGTSTIADLIFLPNDKLVVLNGFPDETGSYRLLVYDIPNLYKNYPSNLEKGVDLFSNLEQIKNIIELPDKGKRYNVMSVSNGKLLIHGTQGINSPSLQSYNIESL